MRFITIWIGLLVFFGVTLAVLGLIAGVITGVVALLDTLEPETSLLIVMVFFTLVIAGVAWVEDKQGE